MAPDDHDQPLAKRTRTRYQCHEHEQQQQQLPTLDLATIAALPCPEWSYRQRLILAPMVRLNTLPFRMLCRVMGCSTLYSEELIALKLQRCYRRINARLGLIEYWEQSHDGRRQHQQQHEQEQEQEVCTPSTGSPVFATYPGEPVALQLGAARAEDALGAALLFARDVRALDLNCGCPEQFSTQGGMGSALLKTPERIADILSTLRRHFPSSSATCSLASGSLDSCSSSSSSSLPSDSLATGLKVTCKIRMLARERDTLELMRRAEACGIDAIAVHARFVEDRPAKVRAMAEEFHRLVSSSLTLPIIYNGDVFETADVASMLERTGAHSLMIARGAMWNASIFRTPFPLAQHLPTLSSFSNHVESSSAVSSPTSTHRGSPPIEQHQFEAHQTCDQCDPDMTNVDGHRLESFKILNQTKVQFTDKKAEAEEKVASSSSSSASEPKFFDCSSIVSTPAFSPVVPFSHYSSSSTSMLPIYDVASAYLTLATTYAPNVANAKWCLQEMLKGHLSFSSAFQALNRAKTFSELQNAMLDLCSEGRATLAVPIVASSQKMRQSHETWSHLLDGPYRVQPVHWQPRTLFLER